MTVPTDVIKIGMRLWRQPSRLLHPQWRQVYFDFPAQMEGNLLFVVGAFVDEERVEFVSLVLQRLPPESQEHRVAFLEQLEIPVLPIETRHRLHESEPCSYWDADGEIVCAVPAAAGEWQP